MQMAVTHDSNRAMRSHGGPSSD